MRYLKVIPLLPELSCVALGTDYYGKKIPEKTADRFLDMFTDAGGNIIDTAHVYSDYLPGEKHMSEKVIGRWLKSSFGTCGGERPLISTKGGFPEIGDMHASRISYRSIREDLYESLDCLDVPQADIYWLHRDDTSVPVEEIVEWMESFRAESLFRCWGVSNWHTERISEAAAYSERAGKTGPECSQIKWSLAEQTPGSDGDDTLALMTPEEYRWYSRNDFPVFAYSSQAKGFFSKLRRSGGADETVSGDGPETRGADAAGKEPIGDTGFVRPAGKAGDRYFNRANLEKYREIELISAETGLTAGQVALAWMTQPRSVRTVPIIGAGNEAQLAESLSGAAAEFDAEIREKYSIFGEYR